MSHHPIIDGHEFATSGARLSGVCPIGDFARLRPLLFADVGEVEYALEGVPEARDRPALRLTIRGALQLGCQRCLAALEFPLRIDVTLALARSQAQLDALPVEAEGPDWVVAGKAMDVLELVEQTIKIK